MKKIKTMKSLVKYLIENNKKISTMESCTGGEIASTITNIEGASNVFEFSAVTYSNEYKIKMGVNKEVINKYSVYSIETANEMSKTISKYTNANYSIGVTGQLKRKDPNNKTNEDETRTYTYEFKLVKTKKDGTELTGAEFKLYDALTDGNEIKVFEVSTGVYRVAKTAEELASATTIKAGTAIIEGLDSDKTYYLEEVVQPAGYNKLTSRVEVKLNEKTGLGETTNIIEVVKTVINYTGTELPSTGGIGTTLFITIGSILVLAMGTILVTKLRVSKMEI